MKTVTTEEFMWTFPDSDSHFADMLAINSEYQYKIKNIISRNLNLLNFDHVVDIGANVGLWTRWFYKMGANKISCFEPITKNIECLRKNTQDIDVVSIYETALGNKKGLLTLYVEKSESNVGQHTIDRNYFGESALIKAFTVPVVTLDSYSFAPTFMKLDVQGAEMIVLEGALNTIKEHRPGLCVECEDKEQSTVRFLESLGYTVVGYTNSDFLMVYEQ